jgi:hypothetical protein
MCSQEKPYLYTLNTPSHFFFRDNPNQTLNYQEEQQGGIKDIPFLTLWLA